VEIGETGEIVEAGAIEETGEIGEAEEIVETRGRHTQLMTRHTGKRQTETKQTRGSWNRQEKLERQLGEAGEIEDAVEIGQAEQVDIDRYRRC